MGKTLCRLGLHRRERLRGAEVAAYVRCRRCGKELDDEGFRAALRAGWWS